jgi:hypothetical protein
MIIDILLTSLFIVTHQASDGKSLKKLVSAAGLEPATHALKGHCSTN